MPPLTEAASSGVSYSAVWSDGAGTVLAGGGRVARLSQGDGGADVWTFVPSVQDSGTLQEVGGIWGSSGTDAWAVGTYGQIFHYDGSILTEVGAGLPSGNPSHIGWLAVAGSSAQDVWAVGTNGQTTHYDGTKWTLSGGTGVADLTGVWIDPQTHDPWACGKSGKLMHHTAASGWQSIASTPVIDYTAITGTSTTAIYITGMGSVLRYDGTTFTDVSPPTTDPLFSNHWYLYAMTADGLGGVVAVGEGGAAMHFDGSSTWTWEDTRFNEQLSGIWLQNGSGWAVGQFGAILRRRP